ncbi:hypothetical protein [Xenorhabdus cabanillasii]|uniref:Tail fiber protein n=1 Tax=Xenorhabdus cabanillasii JM26 TaxID=1427517 RepID=W1IUE4_9GAMM|nr:hypothetical protein [Xenorhabdus cabanillasii]PHM77486.1 tail fiber protein [Xenorhabdus cabanillasii JM26]CDL81433.1 hypothetical protein XCR1_1590013 [Xenorhabdus cabanillasii JM26]
MFGLDNPSGINVIPAITPKNNSIPLWFTEGGAGLSASYPGQEWFNQVQAELLNVLKEAGVTPDKGKLNQLAAAIKAVVSNGALEKAKNGANIPNKYEFVKNLGFIEQAVGTSTTTVMSQNAATSAFANSQRFLTGALESRVTPPNSNVALIIHDSKSSAVYDDDLRKLLWGFDKDGKLTNGEVPSDRVSGLGTASSKNVGNGSLHHIPDMSFFPISGQGTNISMCKLPNGFMLQTFSRGIVAPAGVGEVSTMDILYPTAFPNGICGGICTKGSYAQVVASCERPTKHGFTVASMKLQPISVSETEITFLAVGY